MSEQPTTDNQLTRMEKRLIGLVRTTVPPGDTAMLWASVVGSQADVGILAEDGRGNTHPIEQIPNQLIEQVLLHREAMYGHTGRTWVSLLVNVTPGGGAEFTLGRHEPLPWARPVTEQDWADERAAHPTNAPGVELDDTDTTADSDRTDAEGTDAAADPR